MSQKKISHATFNIRNIEKINENFEELYGREGGSGIGDVGEITTDQVATNPDVLFRDSKGRFKSSETVPELKNQLEVNRWFLEQIEGIEVGGEGGIGDAPSDGKYYGRKNEEWSSLTFDTKQANRRLTNVVTACLAENQVLPEYTGASVFALSNTDGTYIAPESEVGEMDNFLYFHHYNRIAFNNLNSTMIQLQAGDHIEFSNIGSENQCLIMTITAADIEKVGNRYAGVFDFEIKGHNWEHTIKEGLQYTFHAVKGGKIDLPEMTNEATKNTLVLRDNNANVKFTGFTSKYMTFTSSLVSNKADTWFLSGGETSNNGVKRNDAAGMRSSLNVYSKDEVNALSGGEPFFRDIGNNNIEYFGDQLWVTSLNAPFFVGAKIGADSTFSGAVTANKFVGDGSALTGTVSAKVLVDAFESLQLAVAAETTVAGLKSALVVTLGSLIEQLGQKDSEE